MSVSAAAGRSAGASVSAHRRFRAVSVSGLLALSLAGCGTIPDSGPVMAGLSDLSQAEQQVLFNPSSPIPGATQEEIVKGFVSAASSATDDYAIAREYLAPDYVEQWDPAAGVFVDEGTRPYRETDEGVGILSLAASAAVSAEGVLTPVEPGPTTDVRFEFEEIGGEWRISSAPTGIILDRSTFTAVWSAHQLMFLSSDGRIVPETRWFLNGATMATQIVSELLAGPEPGMAGATRSGFPAGAALAANSVPVTDGVAHVDLAGDEVDAEAVTDDMMRQLSASLQSVPGVSRFELLIDGAAVETEDVGRPDEQSPPSTTPEPPSVLRDGAFGAVDAEEVEPLPEVGDAIVNADPEAVTLSYDASAAAVRVGTTISWVTPEGIVEIDGRSGLLEPSVDPFGYVWTYATADPENILATAPEQGSVELPADWLDGAEPVSVRLSPDGTRIAALVPEGDDSAVRVAGVEREEDGRPTAVTADGALQMWATGNPVDFDWVDDVRFAAMTRTGSAGKVTLGGPGQLDSDSGSVPGGESISSGGTRPLLRVLNDDGELFAPQGIGWQRQLDGVEVLSKRG